MGILEHLAELRQRLLRSFMALIVGVGVGILLAEPVLEILLQPYRDINPEEARRLLVLGPTGAVVNYFRVALLVGGVIAVPAITHQIMMFVLPGLTKKERRYVLMTLPAISALFVVGILFAWYILMPPAMAFLESFQSDIFRAEWAANEYLSFVTAILFWMGVAFELPLVLFVLSLLGAVRAGALIRHWRVAIVLSAIAAAIITPTVDPVNMFLVMGPLVALYGISIILVLFGQRLTRR
ncbi:MAG: twin-arginine translocase subunit TatC [Anaerolineaceae bacterium]|nr:MAG: twin-arginine translocase subunit TatC [Anaerolineaceae bacterium]